MRLNEKLSLIIISPIRIYTYFLLYQTFALPYSTVQQQQHQPLTPKFGYFRSRDSSLTLQGKGPTSLSQVSFQSFKLLFQYTERQQHGKTASWRSRSCRSRRSSARATTRGTMTTTSSGRTTSTSSCWSASSR